MNILYIVHDNKKGGAALSFLEMISLISKEHNVYVLVPHKKGFIPEKLKEMQIPYRNAHYFWWEIELPTNKLMAKLRMTAYKILNLFNEPEAYRIRRKIQSLNIDIIHSNSSVINFGAYLSKTTGIPHVWHLREYGEGFGLCKVISNDRYKKIMNDFAVAYIAISKSIKVVFSKIVDEQKIHQIYNGVSSGFNYQKAFVNRDIHEVKFLISGNICREKGQIDVIYAINELQKQGYSNFKVYFAGNGVFEELCGITEVYGLEEYVSFCGQVDDMFQLRKETDVEIIASKYEAFGRVTIEAMRMSNSVIGTNTGGTTELVTEGVNGFFFEYGNYLQLAECMKRYIEDNTLVAEMGKNAFHSMCGKFTPEENAENILALYERLYKGNHN